MALYQDFVEKVMKLAEQAYPGLKASRSDLVPDKVRMAVLELAAMLAAEATPRVQRPWPDQPPVVCIVLARGKMRDKPYTMVLRTHEHVRTEASAGHLADNHGPSPEDHLDGFRFTVAFSGLLRLLEAEARGLIASDDWSWFPEDDPDTPPGEVSDPYWHPEEMLKRVRRWRREVRTIVMVDDLHDR